VESVLKLVCNTLALEEAYVLWETSPDGSLANMRLVSLLTADFQRALSDLVRHIQIRQQKQWRGLALTLVFV
jgi:hypothetical protein